ncbi:hypothetical protein CUN38_04940 [Enterococcus faecium]|uniref:Rha family transcriptional regulator n=1 Tax=Enterococcus faecium TaxID=1352 RepID=UPI000CF0335D|nr:Rha family transcriptional regulator [Enterococcus faecium]PQC93490.1 hypothetical protein CUN38_04940 [Enterococcus faecium]
MEKLVEIRDRKAMTDSLKVAEYFGMEHKAVIRNIGKCVKTLTAPRDSNGGTCAPVGVKNYFIRSGYIDKKGETRPKYYITRDGFLMLVQRFSGERAYILQLDFIDEFNKLNSLKRFNFNFKQF